jgi:hypothetical protein
VKSGWRSGSICAVALVSVGRKEHKKNSAARLLSGLNTRRGMQEVLLCHSNHTIPPCLQST